MVVGACLFWRLERSHGPVCRFSQEFVWQRLAAAAARGDERPHFRLFSLPYNPPGPHARPSFHHFFGCPAAAPFAPPFRALQFGGTWRPARSPSVFSVFPWARFWKANMNIVQSRECPTLDFTRKSAHCREIRRSTACVPGPVVAPKRAARLLSLCARESHGAACAPNCLVEKDVSPVSALSQSSYAAIVRQAGMRS